MQNLDKTNIFVIPSWYPSEGFPTSGVFIKEQINAISNFDNSINQFISTWGHDQGHLSLRNPKTLYKAIKWRIKSSRKIIKYKSNLIELYSPSLSWSNQLPFGGYRSLLKVNRRNLKQAFSLFNNINIIHAHSVYPGGIIASILSKEFNIPFVITEHMGMRNPSLLKKGKPLNEILNAYNEAHKIITVSDFLKIKLEAHNIKNIMVIPNLVNEDVFNIQNKQNKKFIFFTLCQILEIKGIDILLHAIKKMKGVSNSVEFWIGGSGPMLNQYKSLADSLKISSKIKWLGHINPEESPGFFQTCNVFVLPSKYETFGVVYAEAIACGKPVIASRCGGPESIVNDINGVLIKSESVEELSEAMTKMIDNSQNYSSREIRKDFLSKFSRVRVVNQIVEMYKNI
jgi:glycosyltransferase involved in cell wall biosynthesis